jgi:hypothetical protein
MKARISAFFVLFLMISVLTNSYAQENSVTAGGDASGKGGSVSFSVGQVFYTTVTAVAGSVSQGVQQAYELNLPPDTIDININIYPNPTVDNVTLKIDSYLGRNLTYQLVDMVGKLCQIGRVYGPETLVAMEYLPASTYFLKVIENGKVIRIFKIIKY